jgi:nicotinamidase-related amidase
MLVPAKRKGSTVTSETIPIASTGLVVFDLYEGARHTIVERGMNLEPSIVLVNRCRELGIPIFFTRPVHRADGRDLARAHPDMDRQHRRYGDGHPHPSLPAAPAGSADTFPLREFNAGPGDYDITKHRWSAFHATALDLSLRRVGVDTLVLIGGTTHIGVASTLYSARDLDYEVYVVRDCCHGPESELASLLDDIFPQICHVRTSKEVIAAFQ